MTFRPQVSVSLGNVHLRTNTEITRLEFIPNLRFHNGLPINQTFDSSACSAQILFQARFLLEIMGKCSSCGVGTADLAGSGRPAAPRLARRVPRGSRAEGVKYFLELAVDMRWPVPTIPAVAVAVRVHRGYKDAREAMQTGAVVPELARFGANRAAKSKWCC